jgi:hypothetical protein
MRPNRVSMSKFVGSLAVCAFLLGASVASAAPDNLSKPSGRDGKPSKPRSFQVGLIQDKQAFLTSLTGDGYCQSSCCYAWFSGCDEGSVSCPETSCSFSCNGFGYGVTCGAT